MVLTYPKVVDRELGGLPYKFDAFKMVRQITSRSKTCVLVRVQDARYTQAHGAAN